MDFKNMYKYPIGPPLNVKPPFFDFVQRSLFLTAMTTGIVTTAGKAS